MRWVLLLSRWDSPSNTTLQPVCWANTKEALKSFIQEERCESHSFRKGGPLEKYNPPLPEMDYAHFVMDPILSIDEIRRRSVVKTTSGSSSDTPWLCEHANENPWVCKCPGDCYCKTRTCKTRECAQPPR